jgi:vancomycin permeability regulator SanA
MKLTKKRILYLISLPVLWFLIHAVCITMDGRTDEGKSADIAIVLGSKVNEDGTLSERLTKRMECALDLYNAQRVKKLIVSGGLGKEGFYESTKMKEFLVHNGVPDSAVIVDNHGDNTVATVNNSLKLKDSLGFKSAIVVSQYFHVTRTKMLFRNRGFENVSSTSPDYYEIRDLYSILREFAGYYTQS